MAEPREEHNLLQITEATEISHRQAMIEFFEDMWPAYKQYGFTPAKLSCLFSLILFTINCVMSKTL